jgi:hypothetical protein
MRDPLISELKTIDTFVPSTPVNEMLKSELFALMSRLMSDSCNKLPRFVKVIPLTVIGAAALQKV